MVNIIPTVTGGQIGTVYPNVIFIINILMVGHIIIGINIWHVVIVYMIITHRAPIGLTANVQVYMKPDLRIGYLKRYAAE